MQRNHLTVITRSVRFGTAVAISTFALAIVGALSVHADDRAEERAEKRDTTAATAAASSTGVSEAPAPAIAMQRATPVGGDDRAVFEGEPSPESTITSEPIAAPVRAVVRVAPPPPPAPTAPPASTSPVDVPVEVAEPRVTASHATVYDAVASAFPEQPDRAYAVVLCESSANARASSGTGYYGLWQFDLATWRSVGGTGLPSDASVAEQVQRARTLYDRRGWSPWECA